MEPGLTEVTLSTLANGGAVELFEREFQKVLQNIQDPNTDPKAVRKLTLKVAIKPTEDRESGVIAVEVGSSLAANRPLATTLYMGRRDGRLVAVTVDPRQNDMFADSGDVLPLKGKGGVA